MNCVVCDGVLVETKGAVHKIRYTNKLKREPSTWHCPDCGLLYKHPPVRESASRGTR